MEWTERNRERLEIALTEAEVAGVRQFDVDSLTFLIHVSALPEVGPIDRDARRMLALTGVGQASFLLRSVTADGDAPAIPMVNLKSGEIFFDSLAIGGAMYGWRYFDDSSLTAKWPDEPSLVLTMGGRNAAHSFYWFSECARMEEGEVRSYCIEGTVTFEDLSVLRANGQPQSTIEFADQGVLWWQAFQDFEERVNADAQRAWTASRINWREWPGLTASS